MGLLSDCNSCRIAPVLAAESACVDVVFVHEGFFDDFVRLDNGGVRYSLVQQGNYRMGGGYWTTRLRD